MSTHPVLNNVVLSETDVATIRARNKASQRTEAGKAAKLKRMIEDKQNALMLERDPSFD